MKRPLAEELLFGVLAKGGHVRVVGGDEGLELEIDSEEAVAS